MSVQRRCS